MKIECTNNGDGVWRDSRWLALVEFALVVGVYVARRHHILKVSATPYLFLLAWISLRLRRAHGHRWASRGIAPGRRHLCLASPVALVSELFDLFGKQPLLSHLMGKPPDLSNFPAVRGNFKSALIIIAPHLAFGEELVYRG